MAFNTPPFLKSGDSIGIISTARAISSDELHFASSYLEEAGFKVVKGSTIDNQHHQFAGRDEERVKDFNEMVKDPDIKAILCARGGYGTTRILDSIDLDSFYKSPKWIIGYSDVTALLSHLYNTVQIPGIHGPMPINFQQASKESLSALLNLLKGDKISYELPSHQFNRVGIAEGPMVGGNLSVLYSILGSNSFPVKRGSILFIEDLDEYLYHIDRMLLALKRAGVFDLIDGLVVGGMTEMNDNSIPFGLDAESIIQEQLKEYKFPIQFGFPSGHIADNRPWFHGLPATLTVSKGGSRLDLFHASTASQSFQTGS